MHPPAAAAVVAAAAPSSSAALPAEHEGGGISTQGTAQQGYSAEAGYAGHAGERGYDAAQHYQAAGAQPLPGGGSGVSGYTSYNQGQPYTAPYAAAAEYDRGYDPASDYQRQQVSFVGPSRCWEAFCGNGRGAASAGFVWAI